MKTPPYFKPGHRTELGSHLFTEEEIIRFARKYDPQPFHMDSDAALKSVLGGLCASGWHTVSVWMRHQRAHSANLEKELAKQGFAAVEYGPSFGFSDLKWARPVYVGDLITFFNETTGWRPSKSREGWFVLSGEMSGVNQDGDVAISFRSSVLVRYPA